METSKHYRIQLTFDLRRKPGLCKKDGVLIVPTADLVEGLNVTDSHNESLPILTSSELRSMIDFDMAELEGISENSQGKDEEKLFNVRKENNQALCERLETFPTRHRVDILAKIKQEYNNPHYIAVQLPPSSSPRYRIFVEYIRPIGTYEKTWNRLYRKAVLHEITNTPSFMIKYRRYDASESQPTILVIYELGEEYEFGNQMRSPEPTYTEKSRSQTSRPNAEIIYYGNRTRAAILHEVEYHLPQHVHNSSISLSAFSLFLTSMCLIRAFLEYPIDARSDLLVANFPILAVSIIMVIGNKLLITRDRPLVEGFRYLQYTALLAAGIALAILIILPILPPGFPCTCIPFW